MAQLQRENLPSGRPSDKVCATYKTMNDLVDVNIAAGLLKPITRSSRGEQISTASPPLQSRHVRAFVLPNGSPALELCPHRCSVSHDSTCLQNCTDGLTGRMCLNPISISDLKKKKKLVSNSGTGCTNFNQILIVGIGEEVGVGCKSNPRSDSF